MSTSFARDYSIGLAVSIVGHVLLLAVLGLRLVSLPAPEVPRVPLAIEATVIDMGEIRRREEAEQQRIAEVERQRRAEAERKAQREREAAAAEQRRQQEQQRKQQEAEQARIEAQRKAEAERKEAERRKAEEEKRRAEEARIADQKRKEEAERRRQEEERQRLEAERQAEMQRELAEEEALFAAIASGKQAQYLARIRQHVERRWSRPPGAKSGIECVVHVVQAPGGYVRSARIGQCNGDQSVERSIIAAVESASPLPTPDDPKLFDRNLRFTFKPEE